MLPLGKLPDAGQWDESELLVQGFKKKKGTKLECFRQQLYEEPN